MEYKEELSAYGAFVKGTCELMCPESERKMRQKERLLHPLEREDISNTSGNKVGMDAQSETHQKQYKNYVADPHKTVKAFSRSAAGQKLPAPSDLRPFAVLNMTVSYLIEKIACIDLHGSGWVDRYNFVTDRLRSVRQDMVIQNLPPTECVQLLEPMVKFHVFSGYWLCEKSIDIFDPKMNNSFLQECIKSLLVMYNTLQTECYSVTRNLNSDEPDKSPTCSSSEHLMGALYLLINLGDPIALHHSIIKKLERGNHCKSCLEYKAYQLSLAFFLGNYVRTCTLIQKLPPILCMAAAVHLPAIRRFAMMVMATAYSNKSLKFPLKALQEILLWDHMKDVIADCKHYGLTIEDSGPTITFQKGMFGHSAKLVQPKRLNMLDELIMKSSVIKILNS